MLRRLSVGGRCPSACAILPRHLLLVARFQTAAPSYLKVVGDATKGTKSSAQSSCIMTDVVGRQNTASSDLGDRLMAGELLWMIDICAARAAAKHVVGHFTAQASVPLQPNETRDESHRAGRRPPISVATVAMDSVMFRHPVMPGDTLSLEGVVVSCGASSIAVNVRCSRIQFPTRQRQGVANATVFMVAIDEKLKAAKVVPAVGLVSPTHVAWHEFAEAAKATQRVRTDALQKFQQQTTFDLAKLNDARNRAKKFHVPMWETQVHASRVFFQGEVNMNGTVFGGEILRWMETHAVQCGRFFTGNRRVVTLGVHSMEFRNPIYHTDWAQLRAHVVYSRGSTVEVDVEVSVERREGVFTTNVASFVLISLDEVNRPLEIQCGLDLSAVPADGDSLAANGDAPLLSSMAAATKAKSDRGVLTPPRCSPDEVLDLTDDKHKVQRNWLRRYAVAQNRYEWSRNNKTSCLML